MSCTLSPWSRPISFLHWPLREYVRCACGRKEARAEMGVAAIMADNSMLDVVAYTKMQTFSSNQTGNTVMLATASLHLKTNPRHCILAITSLVSWLTAAFIFGQIRRTGEYTQCTRLGLSPPSPSASLLKICCLCWLWDTRWEGGMAMELQFGVTGGERVVEVDIWGDHSSFNRPSPL